VDYRADRHVERNGTVVDNDDAGRLSGRVGLRVFGRSTREGNLVQPSLGVHWLRGSRTSTLDFDDETLAADVPRNRYEVQAGAELRLGNSWGAWAGVSLQRGEGSTATWRASWACVGPGKARWWARLYTSGMGGRAEPRAATIDSATKRSRRTMPDDN